MRSQRTPRVALAACALMLGAAGSVALVTRAEPVRAESWDFTVNLDGIVPDGLVPAPVGPIVPAPSSDRLLYEWLAAYQAWQASIPAGGDVIGMIHAAFDPIGRGDEAVTVAECESGFRPEAQNGQYQGVFQLGAHFEGRANAYGGNRWDPWVNIQVARDTVAADGGWSQWACKP